MYFWLDKNNEAFWTAERVEALMVQAVASTYGESAEHRGDLFLDLVDRVIVGKEMRFILSLKRQSTPVRQAKTHFFGVR